MPKKKRVGRSSDGRTVTFQIDEETRKALDFLLVFAPRGALRAQSLMIRTSIQEFAEMKGFEGKETKKQ